MPQVPRTATLTEAEVSVLRAIAAAIDLRDETLPLAALVRIAAIAGGPPEDFEGPNMPIAVWGGAIGRDDPADVLIAAVERYRRESPHWWINRPASYRFNPGGDGQP